MPSETKSEEKYELNLLGEPTTKLSHENVQQPSEKI